VEEARQHPALSGARWALAALLLAAPALGQALPGGGRVQGDIHRAPDGSITVTPREAAPARPAPPTAGPAPPRPAAAAPAPAKPAAAPAAAAAPSGAPAPPDLDAAACETIRWQPGANLQACAEQLRKARSAARR
jgi:hypothetical protein